jgi:hypothetical protein
VIEFIKKSIICDREMKNAKKGIKEEEEAEEGRGEKKKSSI